MALLAHRSAASRAMAEFLYVTAGLPLGIVWFTVLLCGLCIGLGTVVLLVGVPILSLTLLLVRWGANTERERAALVLGAPIQRVRRPPAAGGLIARWKQRASDRATWRELAYMLLLGPAGILTGAIVVTLWSTALAALAAPAFAWEVSPKSWLGGLDAAALAGVAAGGLVVGALALIVTRGLAAACAGMANTLLAPDERALLAARVSALEATRLAAVESADARLRRLERDLHDGAQHRLSFIAMELDRARSKLASEPAAAAELLSGAHEETKRAMAELRDLVRGIHPSVLTDRGLDAAVSGLAERCPVPVDVDVRLDTRLPAAVETAAYYVVAEALTNVARHAGARAAAVSMQRDGGLLTI